MPESSTETPKDKGKAKATDFPNQPICRRHGRHATDKPRDDVKVLIDFIIKNTSISGKWPMRRIEGLIVI